MAKRKKHEKQVHVSHKPEAVNYPGAEAHSPTMQGSNAAMHELLGTHNPMNKGHQTHLNSIKNKKDSGWRQAEKLGKQHRGRG